MTDADLTDISVRWIPTVFYIGNYSRALVALQYNRYLTNTLMLTVSATIGHVFSCSLAGYALAKYRFVGNTVFFFLVIISMIVPIQLIIIPTYLQFFRLGLIGGYLPILLPAFLGNGLKSGLYIFIFRQYFLGVPREFIEASRIDGCGFIRTFYKIVFPNAKMPVLVTSVLSIIWHWNDYFEPTFYIRSTRWHLLSQRLPSIYTIFRAYDEQCPITLQPLRVFNEGVFMASTFLVVLPLILLYLILQKGFVEGIERTGHVE